MNEWEEIADLVKEMLPSGYDFILGPHSSGMLGWYAAFYQAIDMPHCGNCDNYTVTWDDCGHGETPLEAVEMARAIALELPVEIPSSESFLP